MFVKAFVCVSVVYIASAQTDQVCFSDSFEETTLDLRYNTTVAADLNLQIVDSSTGLAPLNGGAADGAMYLQLSPNDGTSIGSDALIYSLTENDVSTLTPDYLEIAMNKDEGPLTLRLLGFTGDSYDPSQQVFGIALNGVGVPSVQRSLSESENIVGLRPSIDAGWITFRVEFNFDTSQVIVSAVDGEGTPSELAVTSTFLGESAQITPQLSTLWLTMSRSEQGADTAYVDAFSLGLDNATCVFTPMPTSVPTSLPTSAPTVATSAPTVATDLPTGVPTPAPTVLTAGPTTTEAAVGSSAPTPTPTLTLSPDGQVVVTTSAFDEDSLPFWGWILVGVAGTLVAGLLSLCTYRCVRYQPEPKPASNAGVQMTGGAGAAAAATGTAVAGARGAESAGVGDREYDESTDDEDSVARRSSGSNMRTV